MADGNTPASPPPASPLQRHRYAIKSSVHNTAASRRREQAIAIGKERREALIRAKRVCRTPLSGSDDAGIEEDDMVVDKEKEGLEARTAQAVEELKSALSSQGKGAQKKKTEVLRALRRLLSQSEVPPIEAAIKAGAVPLLLLEAAWCLTNIAAGEPEETKSLLPALPLLVAHLGGSVSPLLRKKSSTLVAEQCAWAIGNVAGEGADLRSTLLAQGALWPLARLMLSSKGSAARTAAWALSNLIKGPDPKAVNELIGIEGVLNAIVQNLEKADEELATEVAWVVVYLSALSEKAISLIVRSHVPQLLIRRLLASENLQLLIPVLRGLGNVVAGDGYMVDSILIVGNNITDQALSSLIKCLRSDNRVLRKEASWVLSNIAAGSFEHKKLIFTSEATPVLIHLLNNAQYDIRKEAAYTLGNLCVVPAGSSEPPNIIVEHLVSIINSGALPGFINLLRSADIESARLGLQFLELAMRGYPDGQGPNLVEREDGIEAMERFQFHENDVMRNMANGLVDKYFGEDYGVE
ncbi:importin subunit alpha-2 isoform X3 [Brachypodium distachyon]|uniref:importin subunit alpha-2 isoform X3 n=1 Tax=Brachypodium distachyon TaxID=15368 RepID=UPI000D0DB579|nr:importin subunit alpha-2 isoform X3 [Brachypodium distachyon]|eukprot:XP_024315253.1 importin subunit alpha-2 isoform X3 [Brachypodium distachyon]